jgi:AsmA protein
MPGTGKRFGSLKIIAIAVVLLVAAIVAIPFVLDANQFKPELESKLSSALGREVQLGQLKLSILSGSVKVDDIRIADNPDFSRSPFVDAKSLQVSIELKPLIFSKAIRISGITLKRPLIALIESKSGTWNFSGLGSAGGGSKTITSDASGGSSGKDVFIKELQIVDGQVTIVHAGESPKPSIYNNVNISIKDLSYSTAFPFSLAATLPGEGVLKLEGKAGPFSSNDLMLTPLEAALTVKHFDLISSGFMPKESGLAGLFDFDGTVSSNGKEVQGKGRASANKLRIVKTGAPTDRQISLQYAVSHNLSSHSGKLTDTKIESGKAVAHLSGSYEGRENNLHLKMHLHGANMPVQDLAALLPAFGIALPKGSSLQGGLINADFVAEGPIEKMVATGTADISNTRLTGYDLSGKMAAIATLAGIRPNQDTEIEKFASSLQLTPEGIQVSKLMLIVPSLGELNGNGSIAADQSLDFTMKAMLKPSGAIGTGLTQLVKGGSLNIPFFVRGTASDPKFVPDMKKAAGGLLESVLGQGTKKDQPNSLGDKLRNLLQKKK